MNTIVLFGAGKSATVLIEYLINECANQSWQLIVADANKQMIESKTKNHPNTISIELDITDLQKRRDIIKKATIVISMMPPQLHILIAQDCIEYKKNLLTASYIGADIAALKNEIEKNNLLFIGELGLDPGIDHMSAMYLITEIKNKGGKIISFYSHCGGLITPECDNNPWHYKISWNPRNILLAGSSGAIYKKNNETISISYEHIFDNNATISINEEHVCSWYANRDSISYIPLYHLNDATTFIRTTLRHPAFCRGWNKIIQLSLTQTDDFEKIENCKTFNEWFHRKLFYFERKHISWKEYLEYHVAPAYKNELKQQFEFLGLLNGEPLPPHQSSADILQYLLEKNLNMKPEDKDMIIMLHEIEFELNNKKFKTESCLIVKGENSLHTAMAKTVGLPLGIAAKLILENKISLSGLYIPIHPEIYTPINIELAKNGIKFTEVQKEL